MITAAADKDDAACTALFHQAEHTVKLTVYSIMNPDGKNAIDADDVILDSFIQGFRSIGQLKDPEHYLAWMRSIARNKSIDYLRKNRDLNFSDLSSDDVEFEDTLVDDNDDNRPDIKLDKTAKADIMKEILSSIPQDQRTVMIMYYYNDMKVAEIASELGCSESTVKSRLKYGKTEVEAGVSAAEKKYDMKLHGFSPLLFLLFLLRDAEPTFVCDSGILGSALGQLHGVGAGTAGQLAAEKSINAHRALSKILRNGFHTVGAKIIAAVAGVSVIACASVGITHLVTKSAEKTQESIYSVYSKILETNHNPFAENNRLSAFSYDENAYMLSGLCFADMVDMDQNGVQELIIVDGNKSGDDSVNYTAQIWTVSDGEAKKLFDGDICGGNKNGEDRVTYLTHDGNTYLLTGMVGEQGDILTDIRIYGYSGSQFGNVLSFFYDGDLAILNEEETTIETAEKILSAWVSSETSYGLSYQSGNVSSDFIQNSFSARYLNDADVLNRMVQSTIEKCKK